MDNWLLIIVGTIFLICIAFGYVRGFLKLGLSLLSTILTLVLVLFLSPHVTRALKEYVLKNLSSDLLHAIYNQKQNQPYR